MSLVLARKYRPKTFEDLVGQDVISHSLSNALKRGRLSHAYLFSGLRGSGKTSTARIFAKALLCETGITPKPCESCQHCIMANENRHLDIIEMDGASNRGIDDIKELIEDTKYKPTSGRFKIFIIDEVHMLTPQAFNALLKTLEEPPEFIKFILATTDPLKLPITILSRVQHFRFKKIPQKLIEQHLSHILNLEHIDYEKDAVKLIARAGAGSLRDALTILDQAIIYSQDKISLSKVSEMLGVIEPTIIDELLDYLLNKNENKIIEFVQKSQEYEAETVIDELILKTKELLLNKDKRFSPLILDRFFRVLSDAKELLYIGSDGEFVLLITLYKMLEALSIKELDEIILEFENRLPNSKCNYNKNKKDVKSEIQTQPEPQIQTISSRVNLEKIDHKKEKFQKLVKIVYEKDRNLGEVFEKNVEFISFENSKLILKSKTENKQDKTLLNNNWGNIKFIIKDIFGLDTEIVLQSINRKSNEDREKDKKDKSEKVNLFEPEFKSESSLSEKDKILNEPIVRYAVEKLNPRKIRTIEKVSSE